MKKKLIPLFMVPVVASVTLLGSCNVIEDGGDDPDVGPVVTNKLSLYYGEKTYTADFSIEVDAGSTTNQLRPAANSNATFTSSDENICAVDSTNGLLTPKTNGTTTITAKGGTDGNTTITVTVTVKSTTVSSGIQTYASESVDEKIKIMAALEDYAVENYLTGITMFSNGGYVCYSDRYTPAPSEYVAGYGWGTMREGKLTRNLAKAKKHSDYYNVATTSLPDQANAMDASGSDVSDLAAYFTTPYFTTRLNRAADGYEFVAGLADSEKNMQTGSDGVKKSRPWAVDDKEATIDGTSGQYKRWRIYVKTGDDAPTYALGNSGNLSTAIQNKYNGRKVQLDDYLTPFKFMLTNYNGQYRGSELTDGTSAFEGAADYFAATSTKPSDYDKTKWFNETAWNTYMSKNIFTGKDSKGEYIEFNLLNACTQFYAMYYLSSSLYNPIPADFITDVGTYYGTNVTYSAAQTEGRSNLFKEGCSGSDKLTMVDTTLSCGPYMINEYESGFLSLKRNPYYDVQQHRIDTFSDGTTREIYQIPGFDYVEYASNDKDGRRNSFLNGEVDSYSPDKDDLSASGKFNVDDGSLDVSGQTWHRYATKADATFKLNVNATTEAQWKKFFGRNGTVYAHASDSEYSKYTKFYLSNKHFLNFLSFGMDRQTICESRGKTPTQEYLSDNYLIDPENSVSYNSTDAHKAVLADRYNETYGYNKTAAKNELRTVMNELIKPRNSELTTKYSTGMKGTASNPYMITVDMNWMNPTDTTDYGDVFDSIKDIASELFKEEYASAYELQINQIAGTSSYNDVYDKMKHGEYQLGFGAISGGALDPLNFLEVLKSDNSSGFTLNWGPDTSVVDSENPIVYDGKTWSFDALWNAGNTAVLLNNSGNIANIKNASTGTGNYPNNSGTKNVSVSYTLSFEDLINAGATLTLVRFTNGEHEESLTASELSDLIKNKTLTRTIGSEFNTSEDGKTTYYMFSVIVTYTANANNQTLTMSSTLRLPTSAGL